MPIASCCRFVIALAIAGMTVAGLSGCDAKSAGPVNGSARQVTVVGTGNVKGAPDTLTADVAIEFVAPDVTTAMNQTNDRQQAVINALAAAGVDTKDISTTEVSLQPQFGDNSMISGYRARNSIEVKIRRLDAASQALAAVVTTGGNAARINSVSYTIDDDSKLVSDARARAFEDAENRAQQYANLSGLSLGKVISISEAPGGAIAAPPPPMPMPRAGVATAVPLQPGEQTVNFTVTAVWELF